MGSYSCHPARPGYYLLWPLAYLGDSLVPALVSAGVNYNQKALGWAIASDGGIRRLPARSANEARLLASKTSRRAVLFRAVAGHEKTVWEAVEEISVVPGWSSVLVDECTGILISKASLADRLEIKSIARRLSNSLRSTIKEPGRRAVERFLGTLDVKFSEISATQLDQVFKRARSHLATMAGPDLLKAWAKDVTVVVESAHEKIKQSMKLSFFPSINPSLLQPEKDAARQIGDMAGFWARDSMGRINDRTTLAARKIIASGLKEGLGNADIARNLRKNIPDLYEMRTGQYSETVANVAVQRARTGAQLTTYEQAGVQVLEIQAVLDERTTEQCRFMDGQIIEVADARAVYDAGINVANPEDIASVNPFIEERRDKRTGERWLQTANGAKLATIDRSGKGTLDDRGSMRQHISSKGFGKAGIGMPPYHFRCRTYTVPRFDLHQVPRNYIVRGMGPVERGEVDPGSLGRPKPVQYQRLVSTSQPQAVGTRLDIDSDVLPTLQRASAYTGNNVVGSTYQWTGENWKRKPFDIGDEGALSKLLDGAEMLPTARTGLMDVYSLKHNVDEVVSSLLANEHAIGRDLLVRHVGKDGASSWSRLSLADKTGVRREVNALRSAIEAGDEKKIATARRKLNEAARKRGILKQGDELAAVTRGGHERVSLIAPEAAEDLVAQPTLALVEQPKPARSIGDQSTKDIRLDNRVFSARPSGDDMVEATWKGEHRLGRMRLDQDGNIVGEVNWTRVRRPAGRLDFGDARLSSEDNVAVLYSSAPIDHRDRFLAISTGSNGVGAGNLKEMMKDVIRFEREAIGVHRDWVLTGPAGEAYYLRFDKDVIANRWNAVLDAVEGISGGAARFSDARKLLSDVGVDLSSEVRMFWSNARVDWTQQNYISGVHVGEQVKVRVEATKEWLQKGLDNAERRLGRKLTYEEYLEFFQRRLNRIGKTARKSDKAFVARAKGNAASEEELRDLFLKLNGREDISSIKTLAGNDEEKIWETATKYWGGALSRAAKASPMPALYRDTKDMGAVFNRPYYRVVVKKAPLLPGQKDNFGGIFLGKDASTGTIRHEFIHHLEGVCPRVAEAAKHARLRGISDGELLDIYGDGNELALPVILKNKYAYKVYGSDFVAAKNFDGKTAQAWRDFMENQADVGPWNAQEYLSEGASDTATRSGVFLADWYSNDADQVAFFFSVMSGHYVPF